MNFLVLYGTTEGQTRKIAEFASDRIRLLGESVSLVDAANPGDELRLGDYDGVIIAASVHLGRYQTAVSDFIRARYQTLNGMRSAFLSVSLSAASKDADDIQGIKQCVDQFLGETRWKPGEVHHVAGAFRYTQYDFFKRWGMKMIARQKGMSTDASKDLEMTDWLSLRSMVDAFVDTVRKARSS